VSDDPSDEEARARAIALLEANHAFPTDYAITVIAMATEEVTAAVVAAAFADDETPPQETAHERRASAGGKYLSHRLKIRARDAEHVLVIYARLRSVDGVRTIL
jgi:putative lipoic acid-binding regulatory protein